MKNVPIFKLENIEKHYGAGDESITIFDGMNFSINDGEFIALMGPSGCGKTTLLNMLGGIDQPDQGKILFNGEPIEQFSQAKLTLWRAQFIGFVFQAFNLLPMFSAGRNVELPLLLTSLNRQERRIRVDNALELMDLKHCRDRLPSQLSGGQQQRIAIARAIVSDASILLCDEPTGNLDKASSQQVLEILSMLNKEFNKTIVIVTHDAKAAAYADKTYYLDKGTFIDEHHDSNTSSHQQAVELAR
jgi:putative ABC transport system ATP-binding protein